MNQQAMLRKARQLQKEMQDTQREIEETVFTESVNGMVTVSLKGTKELIDVQISEDFEIESKDEIEMLQDMIVAACNNAYKKIDQTFEEKMAKYQNYFGGMF